MPAALEPSLIPTRKGLGQRLRDIRSSSRLAFILHLVSRMLVSLMALVWTRLLLGTMGKPLFGLFLSFQSVAQLGGLGDLGMGGAVGVQAGQYLGQGKQRELQDYLPAARAVFLLLALTVGGGFLLLSPWLPGWLKFPTVPGAGPLPQLYAVGAVSVGMMMLYSYVSNLNYACGTLTWPVIPALLLLQGCLLAHWWLARNQSPLWVQYIPYAVSSFVSFLLAWVYLRVAFPSLANVLPLRLDFRVVASLLEKSFWLYLAGLGTVIYTATDRLVVQAWFGSDQVPLYNCNYKLCELAVVVILTASFVALPKITQWLAAPGAEARERVLLNLRRLNQFQIVLGCTAALVYLAINDFFMTHWLGRDMQAPLSWQAAFALNLAITTSGDAGIQVAFRCGDRGMRVAGSLIALTGLLNLGLSVLSAKLDHIVGIGLATGIAQSILSLGLGFYSCRHLKLAWLPWAFRSWLLPVAGVCLATAGRMYLPFDSTANILLLAAGYAVMLLAIAWLVGVRPALVREEWELVRSFLRGKRS